MVASPPSYLKGLTEVVSTVNFSRDQLCHGCTQQLVLSHLVDQMSSILRRVSLGNGDHFPSTILTKSLSNIGLYVHGTAHGNVVGKDFPQVPAEDLCRDQT